MLFLRGAETDTLMPDAWAKLQAIFPRATFTEVENTGHLLPLESPDEIAGAIRAFAARVGFGSGANGGGQRNWT